MDYRLGKLRRASAQFPRGQWCAVWYEDGVRRRYGLGVGLEKAEAEARRALAEFCAARDAALQRSKVWLIRDLVDAYHEDRRIEGVWSSSMKSHLQELKRYFGDLSLSDLAKPVVVAGETRTICHAYALDQEQGGRAKSTIRTRLMFLRAVLNWAERRRIIEHSPYVWVPSASPPRDIVASEDDVMRMLAACTNPRIKLFILLAVATGARRQAILDLTWDRVDLQRGIIDYRIPDPASVLRRRRRKGRSVVEIGESLRAVLAEARAQARTAYVIEYRNKPLSNQTLYDWWRDVVVRAGVDSRITPHVLRHSVATWLADRNVDMRKIQKLLGHHSIVITETVYAKYRKGYLQEAAQILDDAIEEARGNRPRHRDE